VRADTRFLLANAFPEGRSPKRNGLRLAGQIAEGPRPQLRKRLVPSRFFKPGETIKSCGRTEPLEGAPEFRPGPKGLTKGSNLQRQLRGDPRKR